MENLYMALSDQTRLRLLNLMREDEICVCFFTEVLDESQPKISRHLAYLRKAELVETRREGKWMHYRIKFPENAFAREVLYDTLEWLKSQEDMQKEYESLIDACCSLNVPTTIAKAPKPEAIIEANTEIETKQEIETYLL
ncbi:MAG: metalloregulator ArsR/SmtB family transcription factor [Acidobacteriota bacterium]|jgi:ArsR family transcriptional regulator|nr:metalloregulator ArsR/SmtB family transcription factor [Acidobacteriota bacterium]